MCKNFPNSFVKKGLFHCWQGLYSFTAVTAIMSLLLCTCASTGFASQAQVLSDDELDQVHAEGIFFDFNVSFGNIDDLIGKTSQSTTPSSSQNAVQQTGSSNVTIISPTQPLTPAQPTAPTPVSTQNTAATPASQDTSAAALTANTAATVIPTDIPGGSIAQNVIQTGVSISDPSNYTTNAAMPTVTPTGTQTLVDIAPTGSNTVNSVVVSDLSQQNLSALVNVNAAGSVVPILLNITININSTVGSVQNNNSLDLQNYYRVNMR